MIKNKLSAMFDDKPVDRAEIVRSVKLARDIAYEAMPLPDSNAALIVTDNDLELRQISFERVLAFLLEYDVES